MTALQAGARIDGRDLWGLALRIVALIVGLMAAVWVVVTALPLVLLLLIALILAAGLSRAGRPAPAGQAARGLAVLLLYLALLLLLVVLGALSVPPIVRACKRWRSGHPSTRTR